MLNVAPAGTEKEEDAHGYTKKAQELIDADKALMAQGGNGKG